MSLVRITVFCFFFSNSVAFSQNETQNGRDSNFVIISAIKSVAGEKPSNEFFDLNLKFNIADWLFVLTSADIALSDVQTDTLKSTQKKLTEAGFSFSYAPILSNDDMRRLSIGVLMKIFSETPYAGILIGGVETSSHSPLFSSYVFVSYLWRGQGIDQSVNKLRDVREAYHNFYVEFALHSPRVEFLKFLRLKGGILLPFENSKINGVQSRIVIEVPIGNITRF